MREIEFRGLRKDGKGWVYGDLIRDYPHHATGYSIQQHGVIIHEVDKGTVCQYTGIKDKNGVKIFEKDRVVGKDGVLGTVDMIDGSYVVRINNKLTVASLSFNEWAVIGVTI